MENETEDKELFALAIEQDGVLDAHVKVERENYVAGASAYYKHARHLDRVRAGYCYDCQVWL